MTRLRLPPDAAGFAGAAFLAGAGAGALASSSGCFEAGVGAEALYGTFDSSYGLAGGEGVGWLVGVSGTLVGV